MPRWVGERIIEVFSREFRAHPQHEYVSIRRPKAYKLSEPTLKVSDFSQKYCTLQERSINAGTLTVNYEKVKILENIFNLTLFWNHILSRLQSSKLTSLRRRGANSMLE